MSEITVGFNQDSSLITVGSNKGFSVYRCAPFEKCFEAGVGGIRIVEILFSTSLVALVGTGHQPAFSPRRVRLYNTKSRSYIADLDFATTVTAVRLCASRLVVALESKIHIFDLRTLKILHTLPTPPNPGGVVALSPSPDRCYMAFPASRSRGEVIVYDVLNLKVVSSINACSNPVKALRMNPDGNRLAVASTQGTVIRVFSVPDGAKLRTFRRGTYATEIHSIAFDSKSRYVAVTSASKTVHVFDMSARDDKKPSSNPLAPSKIARMLPNVLTDIVQSDRSVAHVNVKGGAKQRTTVEFGRDGRLYLLSRLGYFAKYKIPPGGGECRLEIEFPLLARPSEALGVKIHEKGRASADEEAFVLEEEEDDRELPAFSGGLGIGEGKRGAEGKRGGAARVEGSMLARGGDAKAQARGGLSGRPEDLASAASIDDDEDPPTII